uniref:Uncharacterized protein n=1 Tax=Heterorhabditis bacteriophora TaxID=37862 RepID=A0A1I7WQF3_HETBA
MNRKNMIKTKNYCKSWMLLMTRKEMLTSPRNKHEKSLSVALLIQKQIACSLPKR